ncbi:protein FAM177A1-like [Haliotis rufescens]|uniref:protein FAM177A1-like n=1 Tax=Haliotis rufescens TaxID=6454 RepID=UPI001EAFF288|nr:protein FAM177A1-like [Haliotis rufescens]
MSESTNASQKTTDFTNVPLSHGDCQDKENPKKKPKRVLHFSDGILEEYSTDEEDVQIKPKEPSVDPKKLSWLPWFWYCLMTASARTLSVADLCGEKLAWFFGITAPKYQYAIDEYYRLKEEEDKDKEMMERQHAELSSINIQVVEQSKVPQQPASQSPLKY